MSSAEQDRCEEFDCPEGCAIDDRPHTHYDPASTPEQSASFDREQAAYTRGLNRGKLRERAQIVSWLRQSGPSGLTHMRGGNPAQAIEAGAHVSGQASEQHDSEGSEHADDVGKLRAYIVGRRKLSLDEARGDWNSADYENVERMLGDYQLYDHFLHLINNRWLWADE